MNREPARGPGDGGPPHPDPAVVLPAVPDRVLDKIIERIPVGRLGKASEIARAIRFLTDDDAGFITGSTLSINGGQHMY